MIKYRSFCGEIKAIEVLRETDKMVYISEHTREAKRSDHQNWFDSWDDAKAFLVAKAKEEVAIAQMNLERAKVKLWQIQGMRKI